MKVVIEIPEEAYKLLQTDGVDWFGAEHILNAVANGTPLDEVFDEIRAEIIDCLKALDDIEKFNIYNPNEMAVRRLTYQQCLGFIDKHRIESEE